MDRIEQLRARTIAWNDAWNSRDPAELVAFFAEDGTYYDSDLHTGPVPGATGIGPVARQTWQDWPDARFEVVSLTVEPPRVVLEWASTAKHRRGVTSRLEGVDVLEWRDDRIVAARVYYDVHRRKQALGEAH